VADDRDELQTDERLRRSVARSLGNALLALLLLGLLGAWASLGAFTLKPGQSAVLLFLGRHTETIDRDGFHLRLPPPFVSREIVNVSELRNEDFGFRGREDENTPKQALEQASMQTSDNNIVRVSFAVQYTVKDAFLARFRLAHPELVVRDAAEAAMREIVGHMTVDGVLREQRALVATEVSDLLQKILDDYDAGLDVRGVQLQDVQPPAQVRAAFDDVVAANQDANRVVNEAEGYRNEVIPKARAQSAEIVEAANGDRDAKIAEATGQASRFEAVAREYHKAPEVTSERLYLETMEAVLPDAEKVIVERGTAQVLPYLPLGRTEGPR
jgi:modulator of FtsH protease HflK